ncbi:uncharacterized protein EKO05_0002328 [Ascochyta rabiei]|uniref:uncharacterized protein n=1 Tax=Didymella rabiei TaxID=5454 RepID=UPI00190170C0|nr:uncharacterized protein EKO05_0002328 [Ascochyta rabiei]UPX11737.1 hypothetical protein EKO05_0002328 [Ascochyta rabiei]
MANIYMHSSSSAYSILEQARSDFWNSNAHLTEEQRLEAWSHASAASTFPNNAFSNPAEPSMAHQIPRTMPIGVLNLTQLPMDRTQSAPASRPRSTTSPESINLQRSASDFTIWSATSNEPTNDYALYSEQSMRNQASLQAIPETAVEYTPRDYINTCIEQASSPSAPFQNMHVQLTPQWCPSSDCSTSPSTPQTALMTPVTQSSNSMSRQSSLNTSFLDETSLRVQSDLSFMPILPEDSALSFPCYESKFDSNFLAFTGPTASETVVFPAFSVPTSIASVNTLASSGQHQTRSYLAEDMRRSASHSSESDASDASAPNSTCSRQSRREREINATAASRPLAPKASEHDAATLSAPSNAQMARIRSEDGSSKTVGIISKTPYVRPQHPKIMCQYCEGRPNGFRGTHELDRHIARAHAVVRKGYICVAPSFQKNFLDSCKHCRNNKVYGAYYNAAAHLRRAHFHPRKRGRKGKNDEKRGGIGGGDHPAMDWLKQHWIQEMEVPNNPLPASPDSASDSAPEPELATRHGYETSVGGGGGGGYETSSLPAAEPEYMVVEKSYPAGQQQLPQIPLDYGLSASIHPVDPILYDDSAYMPYTEVSNFEFDAYAMNP